MARHANIDGPPLVYVTSGTWPYANVRDEPAAYAQGIARRIAENIGERSLRQVATQAGVAHTTLAALLAGERWADLITLARLEQALGVPIWPDRV